MRECIKSFAVLRVCGGYDPAGPLMMIDIRPFA
nr:MAG TPA: hypothetical protein [Caudoviricetes sp.]